MLNASIAPRSGTTYGLSSHNTYKMQKLSDSKQSKRDLRSYESQGSHSESIDEANDPGQTESFRPDRVKHKVAITSDKKQPRNDQRDEMASLESSGSEKMIVRLRTDLSIHYSDEEPRRENASSGTIAEHGHQDAVHAKSPV
jgi:hypothetical protein